MNFESAFWSICFIAAAFINIANADLKEIECKGKMYKIDEEHQIGIQECLSELGLKSFKQLSVSTAGCFSRCTMIKKGVIDDAGKPHKEKIMNLIDEHIGEDMKDEWKTAIDKCIDEEGSKIDINDTNGCQSFMPLTLCVHEAYINICHP